jgi:hypothetical protein
MQRPLTIVVGGYIVGFPLGGMTWHHLNYLLGLAELGHEVWFLEDSGSYSLPYNPVTWKCEVDSTYGRAYLERTLSNYGLPIQYCYYSEFEDRHYGLSGPELNALLKRADLLLCVSGVTPLRPDRPRPKCTAVIDTDPVFTQLRMTDDQQFRGYYKQFDAVTTFGRLIGTDACPLPTHGMKWIPTNQPVALRHWPVIPSNSRRFTTVGKWEHTSDRHLEFAGEKYRSSKGVEWMKVIDLPRRTKWEMAVGMSAMSGEAKEQFTQHGWQLLDAEAATIDCQAFGRFIAESAGEFTVAKEIYAKLPSGWFSDRSAAYLASGKPVVTQASGFDRWLPTGRGLFSFQTIDDAAAAMNQIDLDYAGHSAAARQLAEKYFDAKIVLGELLARVM